MRGGRDDPKERDWMAKTPPYLVGTLCGHDQLGTWKAVEEEEMNDNKKDGGPAFPPHVWEPEIEPIGAQTIAQPDRAKVRFKQAPSGMSLRDYFAAHAPAEPQGWFEPVMDGPRPMVYRLPRHMGGGLTDDPFGESFLDEGQQRLADLWDAEQARERRIQWPYAWADAMLKERER